MDEPEIGINYEAFPGIKWKDLETQSKCAPEQKHHALAWIDTCLGYMPEPHIYMPHIAFIQVLTDNLNKGVISYENFCDEVVFHVKRIRNDDMKKGEWVRHKTYSGSLIEDYNKTSAIYKDAARNRLSKLLGYEPSLDHSLEAELYLRQLFELDYFHSDMAYCYADLKAVTIVRYREAFLLEGEAIADDSDLMGLAYEFKKTERLNKAN